MSERPSVLVTRRLPPAVEAALAVRFHVVQDAEDRPLSERALREGLRAHDALLCTVTDRLSADCFDGGGVRARLIANFGVGVDHIALDAARGAGVTVTNTPDVLTEDTADLAILLMLAVLRRAGEGERELREGRWTGWRPTHLLGRRLTGRTLGIVGFGRIGSAVARRARAGFGMPVVAWTRTPPDAGVTGVRFVPTLEALLEAADVISLHCPSTPATRHLMGAAQFARMRARAILINTSRGDVVDEQALVDALCDRRIAGAGLDVFEQEPAVHPGLIERDDVVLLPHLGSATFETREAMGMRALANLDAFFSGTPPPDRVA